MRVKSLSHAGITVSNLESAIKWYWDVFRMPVVDVREFSSDYVEQMKDLYNLENCSLRLAMLLCPKGGAVEIFEFSKMEAVSHRWNAPGVTHFTIDVSNVKGWHKKLSTRDDVKILCPPQKTGANDWFFFRDPDGNLIELIDLKFNYFLMRRLGKLAGFLMRKGPFKSYYS
jgi:catechol 2,3-dioxygenase-like lactoylglutathione lyase family enzyme